MEAESHLLFAVISRGCSLGSSKAVWNYLLSEIVTGFQGFFWIKMPDRYILPLYRKYIIIKSFNQLYVVKM